MFEVLVIRHANGTLIEIQRGCRSAELEYGKGVYALLHREKNGSSLGTRILDFKNTNPGAVVDRASGLLVGELCKIRCVVD